MKHSYFIALLALLLNACIGDDVIQDMVPEQLRLVMMADSIALGDQFQFEARYTNNVGQTEEGLVQWSSSDENILSIDPSGLATAKAQGTVLVRAYVDEADRTPLEEIFQVIVGSTTNVSEIVSSERSGTIRTTSSYKLEGDFTLSENNGTLLLTIADNYEASSALPGLYLYLTNNPSTNTGAFTVGAVEVFKGGHTYEISGVGLNDFDYLLYFCKPFGVKVGDAEIK